MWCSYGRLSPSPSCPWCWFQCDPCSWCWCAPSNLAWCGQSCSCGLASLNAGSSYAGSQPNDSGPSYGRGTRMRRGSAGMRCGSARMRRRRAPVLGEGECRNHDHERKPDMLPRGNSTHLEIHCLLLHFKVSSGCQSTNVQASRYTRLSDRCLGPGEKTARKLQRHILKAETASRSGATLSKTPPQAQSFFWDAVMS